ncbi:MAG TPA: hypothetical protein VEC17_00385, partial [Candidatus Binatia bacterium]|nr:hypothetical protein [Candidatus Binatia bacterium]
NNVGLLVRLNGREAPLPAGANPNNGGYVVHVNGKWIGSGSAREILLSRGDTWDLFDWNGRNP